MKYWLQLFDEKSYAEFLKSNGSLCSFHGYHHVSVSKIHPGDVFICYIVKKQVFAAAARVIKYIEDCPVTPYEIEFPVRFQVESIVSRPIDHTIPIRAIQGKTPFYPSGAKLSSVVRTSMRQIDSESGDAIVRMLKSGAKVEGDRVQVNAKTVQVQSVSPKANADPRWTRISTVVTRPVHNSSILRVTIDAEKFTVEVISGPSMVDTIAWNPIGRMDTKEVLRQADKIFDNYNAAKTPNPNPVTQDVV